LVACAALAALTAAVPWLVPVSGFIPTVEAIASKRLGVPVQVGELRVALLPLPHATAEAVTLGDPEIGQIERIRVWPRLSRLFADTLVVREVRFEGAVVTQELVAGLFALPAADEPRRARVERVKLERGELRLRGATLREVSAEVDLDDDGRVLGIQADSARKLRVHARPEAGKRWSLDIAAIEWTPPAGPAIVFDRIDASATVDRDGIATRDLVARLYGGRVTGALRVGWKPMWSIDGDLVVEGVRLQPLATLVAGNRSISGKLSGKPRFELRARRANDLLASLMLQSDFVVEDGTLHKVDLVAAARNPLAAKPASGETRFDELSGHLEIDADGYHFSRLNVASGLLRASGEVSVGRDQRLDGHIDAELRGTATLLSVPLNVSGTTQDPSVAPTKTAVAGALAGSVLLPGIGTAIGFKAGQLTNRLFGKRREPAAAKSAVEPAPRAVSPGR
jgi:uncharacterized protein involved in outer membrane biogenesis